MCVSALTRVVLCRDGPYPRRAAWCALRSFAGYVHMAEQRAQVTGDLDGHRRCRFHRSSDGLFLRRQDGRDAVMIR